MKDGPNIVGIAALVGEHARADILTALMTGEALTATELAGIANVTKQTVSTHLSKLVDAGLLAVERQGRHRYFRLAGRDVAELVESLMGVAYRTGAVRTRASPRESALRHARVCYDHLAGDLGVLVYDGMVQLRLLAAGPDGIALTARGRKFCRDLGVDVDATDSQRRAHCRPCLDWSARRYHLAGSVGAALLRRFIDLGWARRARDSRVVHFTPAGEARLREHFAR